MENTRRLPQALNQGRGLDFETERPKSCRELKMSFLFPIVVFILSGALPTSVALSKIRFQKLPEMTKDTAS